MKVAYGRFVPETVAECADMLAASVGRSYEWTEQMRTVAHEWMAAFSPEQVAALATGDGPDDYYPDLLPVEDIKTLALAYALREFAGYFRPRATPAPVSVTNW